MEQCDDIVELTILGLTWIVVSAFACLSARAKVPDSLLAYCL